MQAPDGCHTDSLLLRQTKQPQVQAFSIVNSHFGIRGTYRRFGLWPPLKKLSLMILCDTQSRQMNEKMETMFLFEINRIYFNLK